MIVFQESGRFGNQLFQYAALRTFADAKERLVMIGCDELVQVFENLDASFPLPAANFRRLHYLLRKSRTVVERTVTGLRLCDSLVEGKIATNVAIIRRPGMISCIKYCTESYFQGMRYFREEVVDRLRIRSTWQQEANSVLQDAITQGRPAVFVHVRRGDYLHYPSIENPAVLPDRWYFRAMDEIRQQLQNPLFFVIGDDPAYLDAHFRSTVDVRIVKRSPTTEFALMTMCEAGILSASSFAWWGAYFANRRRKAKLLIAPKYWMGHPVGVWNPQYIGSSFLEFRTTVSSASVWVPRSN